MSFQQKLISRIKSEGDLSVADYMDACNRHYYGTRDPLGRAGDFITAPEISQIFGELVAVWLLDTVAQFGALTHFALVECGPGRGTLMSDILRTLKRFNPLNENHSLFMMECSDTLKLAQKSALAPFALQNVTWISDLNDPLLKTFEGPIFMIGNEFLDALPIEQYIFDDQHWHQRRLQIKNDSLIWEKRKAKAPISLPDASPKNQDIFENSPAIEAFLKETSSLLRQKTGAALFIDYGSSETLYGDSFQAVKNHTYVDVLSTPGEADLTAHVNFERVRNIFVSEKLFPSTITTQKDFLERLGLHVRADKLKLNASERQRADITNSIQRLSAPDEMGSLFKVLGVSSRPLQMMGLT